MAKTGIKGLSTDRVRELAGAGAQVVIKRLRAEIVAIERAFPELRQGPRAIRRSVARATKRARTMSAAARRAASARMKRYWAERRRVQARMARKTK